MVKIAVAGGTGQIGRIVVDGLIATGKHNILILSRKDPAENEAIPGATFVKADYQDTAQLASILNGVHTVLSFIVAHGDPGSLTQKSLIDAAIAAGVKRFAPSEWATSNYEELPWYAEKGNIKAYLEEINKEKKVLEYSLFQVGGLLDMFAPPGTANKHVKEIELPFDFVHRRALVLEGKDSLFTFTAAKDIASVVALAIDYEGEWPLVGGIQGWTVPISKLLEVGAKVRGGKPFDITYLKEADVRAGDIKSSWLPQVAPPSTPKDQADYFSKVIVVGFLLSGMHSAWAVSNEWNKLLPDYKFTDAEEFLAKVWAGQPLR